jgi:DNA-binding transcriptional regulator YiaG
MKEIWKRIPGWPYEASSLGRIRRQLNSLYLNSNADGMLSLSRDRKGYLHVSLSKNNHRKNFCVAHLVAQVFHGKRPRGYVCAHKNSVPFDNRASNLRWSTNQENERDKTSHGTKIYGSKHSLAKLSDKKVAEIKKLLASKKLTQSEIALRYGVNKSKISHINTGISWKHV